MSANNDGGPAFPHHETTSTGEPYYDHLGMSLRDWFAGQAMAGLCVSWYDHHRDDYATRHGGGPDQIAIAAYLHADAMLAAKEARK